MSSHRPVRAAVPPLSKGRLAAGGKDAAVVAGALPRREKTSSAGSAKGDLGSSSAAPSRRQTSAPIPGVRPPAKGKLTRVDGEATNKQIQKEWRSKRGSDLMTKLDRINSLLDNPLTSTDSIAAAVIVQRYARGFLVRRRRQKGALYPVESQSHADAKAMLPHYGASVYALVPSERRRRVVEHHAARRIQRAARTKWGLLWSLSSKNGVGGTINKEGGEEAMPFGGFVGGAAALTLQRVARGHLARRRCRMMVARMSKGTAQYSKFLSTDLRNAPGALRGQQAVAARHIQAAYRGTKCRKGLRRDTAREMWAAVLIQSWFRGRAVRKFADGVRNRIVLRRVLNMWNKIMWTLASPIKFLERNPSPPPLNSSLKHHARGGAIVVDDDNDAAPSTRSPSRLAADFANFLQASPTKRVSPKGAVTPRTSFSQLGSPEGVGKVVETPRRSVVVDAESGQVVVRDLEHDGEVCKVEEEEEEEEEERGGGGEREREREREEEERLREVEEQDKDKDKQRQTEEDKERKRQERKDAEEEKRGGKRVERPPPRSLDDRMPDGKRTYPEWFTSSMDLEPGVLAWAIKEDAAATSVQRCVRAWLGRGGRAAMSAAHTPPNGGGGSLKTPVRGGSTCGVRAESPGGAKGMMSEEESQAWRVEIETQVKSIHVRLDSARKEARARARSRTPPGVDVEVVRAAPAKPAERITGLPMIPTPPRR